MSVPSGGLQHRLGAQAVVVRIPDRVIERRQDSGVRREVCDVGDLTLTADFTQQVDVAQVESTELEARGVGLEIGQARLLQCGRIIDFAEIVDTGYGPAGIEQSLGEPESDGVLLRHACNFRGLSQLTLGGMAVPFA